jgi:hypothetical protein
MSYPVAETKQGNKLFSYIRQEFYFINIAGNWKPEEGYRVSWGNIILPLQKKFSLSQGV